MDATTAFGITGAGLTGTLRLTWVSDDLAHVLGQRQRNPVDARRDLVRAFLQPLVALASRHTAGRVPVGAKARRPHGTILAYQADSSAQGRGGDRNVGPLLRLG